MNAMAVSLSNPSAPRPKGSHRREGRQRYTRPRKGERHGHGTARPLDRRALGTDRGAHALAGRADRGADPAYRAPRRADARLRHAHVRPGPAAGEGGRGRDRRRPDPGRAPRDPVRAQGHLRHEGHPDVGPFARLHRPDSGRGRHHDEPALRGGRRAPRQAGDPRDGARRPLVRSALAAGAQSLESGALHRRLLVGLGRRRRRGDGPGGAGLGHGRLDPRPGIALRRRRADADVRAGEPRRRHHQLVHVRPLRAARADVEDCALTLEALAGYDPKDAGSLSRPIPRYRRALGQDLRGLRIGVLRHHWEEDIPASADVRTAMDAALDVLRRLGAELEECRVRPLGSYFDVKIIIAESEIFSVHQKNLVARPKDFGADFRSRAFPSVLFTANDYVQATREHRRMMVEMEPLFSRFDAFVTAGMGEAPRIADYRSVSFWQKPSLLTAWNVTGQPVLMLPNGFGRNGLPLGMQIVGRPFGETSILRIGHAYERATEWHA